MHLAPQPSRHRATAVALLGLFTALCLAAPPSFAQLWTESGDAGDLPGTAQSTVGSGAITSIQGTLVNDADIDMYCIRIDDPQAFMAQLNCTLVNDKNLFLFDAAGNGVALADGCAFGATQIAPGLVPVAGNYLLAVTGEYAEALNFANLSLWTPSPVGGSRPPDGPGAPPIVSWGGARLVNLPLGYSVALTGCSYCDAATPAAPRTWGRMKSIYR